MKQEKWVIFTRQQEYFIFDIHQVSKHEDYLRQENQKYRTIYYLDNVATHYKVGKGLIPMTRDEEQAIICSIKGVGNEMPRSFIEYFYLICFIIGIVFLYISAINI
ncbi:hypothetical protein F9U64_16270 [Gracilibacillus oryzae]|uniref:Uncharacterized protein n=1 Tax=Gracilibacillus oryzae TaxID=1672701 RepID=A0A7C8KNR2_9BACI|nr:hypothetical protein [Gracilibacillus oryzae]KAB8128486.1 hypothetical protein F9U64_16270 [Gracilibacillus oryzae]